MEIRASGEFEFADMRRACRALLIRRKWVWYAEIVIGFLMIVVGAFVSISSPEMFTEMLPLIVIGLILGSMGWWVPLITARGMWKNNRALPGRHEFEFDEAGMRRQGQTSSSELKWTGVYSWSEDKYLFTLFISPGGAVMVPKRFLNNAADVESLRHLLISQVGSPK
jgi:hypothetical protein